MAGEEGIALLDQSRKVPGMSTADIPFDPNQNYENSRSETDYFHGWGGGDRTPECMDQNHVPYHLATPHQSAEEQGQL